MIYNLLTDYLLVCDFDTILEVECVEEFRSRGNRGRMESENSARTVQVPDREFHWKITRWHTRSAEVAQTCGEW